jgi:hypothetical protein
MVKVLLTLMEDGIVGLPIHDGLVVAMSAEAKAKTVMMDVFKDQVGVECPISVDRPNEVGTNLVPNRLVHDVGGRGINHHL